jgi:hypothetical protein
VRDENGRCTAGGGQGGGTMGSMSGKKRRPVRAALRRIAQCGGGGLESRACALCEKAEEFGDGVGNTEYPIFME